MTIAIRASSSDEWLDITEYIADFGIGDADLVDEQSGRNNLNGKLINNIICSKEYYDISFIDLPWDMMAQIMNVVRGRRNIQFKYPSPLKADTLSIKRFQVQDRTGKCKMIHKKLNGKEEVLWTGLSFRLAEI